MRRKILSIVLTLSMVLTTVPTAALAEEPEGTGLCPHHTEHTEECGYAGPVEGTPCAHEHTEECYIAVTNCVHVHDESCYSDVEDLETTEPKESEGGEEQVLEAAKNALEPVACAHVCTAESGCVARTLDCAHEHDGSCGYVEAANGAPW